MIDLYSTVVRSTSALTAKLAGEIVLMNAFDGSYLVMKSTSRDIWQLLEIPTKVDCLCDKLADRYEVDRPVVEADTLLFLRYLHNLKLVDEID